MQCEDFEGGEGVEDVDVEQLERLAESLLADIARDLEESNQETTREGCFTEQHTVPAKVVGKTSECVEPSVSEDTPVNGDASIEQAISPYLVLHHHNYAAKPCTETNYHFKKHNLMSSTHYRQNRNVHNGRKLKKIRPKTANKSEKVLPKNPEIRLSCPDQISSQKNVAPEFLYGTFDTDSNCITIIVNDENDLLLNESVTEVVPLTPADHRGDYSFEMNVEENDSMSTLMPHSPSGSFTSDCNSSLSLSPSHSSGYESIDSPRSIHSMEDDDIWDKSVSELFPSLI